MKRLKKDATSFKKLNAAQMGGVKGGAYIEIIIDGQKQLIWVPD
jgi:hypothetical protein